MSTKFATPFRPVNNDRMAAFTAFRQQAAQKTEGAAALVLPSIPSTRPSHINDEQAENILEEMQHQNEQELMKAHVNLDSERVARLLNLLD